MSAGGALQVTCPAEAREAFTALKQRRKHRFITYSVDPDSFALTVDKLGAPSALGADFLKALPTMHARFCVYDYEFTTKDGRKVSKLFFILWTPSAAVGKDNMLYASQRRALDAVFSGVEDAQCSSTQQVAKLLNLKDSMPDEDEEDWDPDA